MDSKSWREGFGALHDFHAGGVEAAVDGEPVIAGALADFAEEDVAKGRGRDAFETVDLGAADAGEQRLVVPAGVDTEVLAAAVDDFRRPVP